MTMADTIAVMNEGRIEQMGSPADLYEAPRTAFVANFLGQSNLLTSKVTSRLGDSIAVETNGQRLTLPSSRVVSQADRLLVGIRPEKILLAAGDVDEPDVNVLRGGVVIDTSFVGVSTQYLVRMPWDQEIMVFSQNLGVADIVPVGTAVTLAWNPKHGFGLDGNEDVNAGVALDDLVAAGG